MIEIESGYIFGNKTFRYLYPIVNSYSKEFSSKHNRVGLHLRAAAISDIKYVKAKGVEYETHLFLVYDENGAFDIEKKRYANIQYGRQVFKEFLQFARQYTHYEDDYYFEKIKGHLHCVVFKVPKRFHGAIEQLKSSNYSKMYSDKDLSDIDIRPKNRLKQPDFRYGILRRTHEYMESFEAILQERFNSNIELDEDDPREYDFPFKLEDEIFNYERN